MSSTTLLSLPADTDTYLSLHREFDYAFHYNPTALNACLLVEHLRKSDVLPRTHFNGAKVTRSVQIAAAT